MRLASILFVAALIAAGPAGCQKPSGGTSSVKGPPSEQSDATASVIKPERRTIPNEVRQPGHIEAFEQTPIFAKIAGYVEKWNVDIDDTVEKGQVLATLSVPELQVELKQKAALILQADAELQLAKDTVAGAEAEQKRMKSQHERMARVGQNGLMDKDAVEESKYAYELSTAKLSMARSDVDVKEARLKVANENRDHVKALLNYTELKAPFLGKITRRNIDNGHFVQPASGNKAEALYMVERHDKVRIFVHVPEPDAPWVNKGARAKIRVDALQGQEFRGEVARTSYSLERDARTLLTEIDLENARNQLRPGMYVSATINADHANVLTLPAAAVLSQGDATQGYQSFCFMVESGKAVRTPVQVGRSDGKFIEALRKQKPGSTIWEDFTGDESVAAKAAGLTDGQAIK